ncbi:MAG: hypothetical protein HKN44_12755 [Ilumatobacter sp.]|nr:hypothetical protein [Ilumatobacter sp.]
MTIEKGAAWGRTVPRPNDLVVAANDADVVTALRDGRPVAPAAGDLHRTVGGRDSTDAAELNELPIDLLAVTLDDGETRVACAHVVVRQPWFRGGWWFGQVLMVMNAEFLGRWHVVARGHPNDGRVESCEWGRPLGIRQRIAARRRLPAGAHVPHPLIATRAFRQRTWEFEMPMVVRVDGVAAGRSRSLVIDVRPDAGVIYA